MSKLRMIHTQTVRETGNPLISQLPLAKESRSSGPGSGSGSSQKSIPHWIS